MKSGEDYQTDFQPVIRRGARSGLAARVVLLLVILVILAVTAYQYHSFLRDDVILALLGVFAVLGIFFVVSLILGLVRLFPSDRQDIIARAFLDQYPDAVVLTDHRDRMVYANASYGRITGTRRGQSVPELNALLSEDPESSEAVYRLSHSVRSGIDGQEEFRLSSGLSGKAEADARWYRLHARYFPVKDRTARNRNFHIWQIRDITEERQEQERYFKELQKAIDYLDHAPVGFMTADGAGRIQYVNATLASWLELDLATFVPSELSLDDLVPGDGKPLMDTVRPEPGQRKSESLDVSLRLTSGRHIPVRLLHDVSADREGVVTESRSVVLHRSDEAPEVDGASGARFFDDTPMAIATVDRDGRILTGNARFLTMFADLVGREDLGGGARIDALISAADRGAMEEAVAAAADRQGDIAPFEACHARDDSRHFRFFLHAASGSETGTAALVYAIDISDQKALEAQMARTQKLNAVGTLAGGIAHDFNNVLTAILLSADHLLLQSRASDPEFADLVEIKRNANRASLLVRQLLAFSRQQTMRPEVVDLTDVVGEMRMMIERLIGGSDVRLKTEFARDLWPVKTDPGQFGQVITNLCVNARDAMPEGGTLTVRTRNIPSEEVAALGAREVPEKDFVMVEVADTGTGIAPDLLDKIFEPFFTTKDVGKGTGLGLAMVYGIVTQSGGYLHPVSEVGKGTKFVILLPRHQRDTVAIDHSGAPKDHKGQPIAAAFSEANEGDGEAPREEDMDLTGQSAVVLLVEDEDAVRRSGKRMLEMRGFTVHEADTGVHALKILEELGGAVDIVVSDVVMPEMDGPSLLREARKDYPELKFIFVSGYADDAFAKNLPDDAKFGFLPKPYNLKQLVAAVWEMIREG
ncbi:cell cycle histidine kinase CckA [Martelella mediterranea]|uniref:histidine kinase n=1 Tax=Martelella mediterranea TaxID=293089 RepID=A0A4R3NUQ3_9HYPH|nr:ATP-binding protein [Martelella mediterranea]TCT40292.1 two-component system cell cycle sensor histidine kinase/response regulator CckA [Martelella mediterranea]